MTMVMKNQAKGVEWPTPQDVRSIRERTKLSQAEFARTFGISIRVVQGFEQGIRRPNSTARTLLLLIDCETDLVRRILSRNALDKSRAQL